jgi:hypothetical protein
MRRTVRGASGACSLRGSWGLTVGRCGIASQGNVCGPCAPPECCGRLWVDPLRIPI